MAIAALTRTAIRQRNTRLSLNLLGSQFARQQRVVAQFEILLKLKKSHPELAKDLVRNQSTLSAGPRQVPRPAEERRIFGTTKMKLQIEPLPNNDATRKRLPGILS